MLVATPWKLRWVEVLSWQDGPHARLETAAWPATDSTGELAILKPPVMKFDAWQVLQPPVPSAMWLAAPVVPTVPGGTTIVTPNHAMPELWQVWQVNDDTAVWPAADSAGVVLIWKPVPVIASAVAWQALQCAEAIGMWLPAPGVPTVPGCCFGWPPVPWLVPENGPLPGPWQVL